jgi:hypothetical protein
MRGRLEAAICHPLRIAVLPESEPRGAILVFTPNGDGPGVLPPDPIADAHHMNHERFVVKHYVGEAYPCIKGSGLDFEVVGDRGDAEDIAAQLNELLGIHKDPPEIPKEGGAPTG